MAVLQRDDERCGRDGGDVVDAWRPRAARSGAARPSTRRKTDSSVTITSAAPRARSAGSVHSATTFGSPLDDVAVIVTITRRAPTTRSIAPPTPSTSLPGIAQLAMSPLAAHLQRAEHGNVDVAAADHREARGAVEVRRAGQRGDRAASRRRSGRGRARPRSAAARRRAGRSRCGGTTPCRRRGTRDEVRDADAEIHDLAGSELPRGALRDAAPWRRRSCARHQLVDVEVRRDDGLRLELAELDDLARLGDRDLSPRWPSAD